MERIRWYEQMVEAYKALSDERRAELDRWYATKGEDEDIADWPAWEKILGPKPKKPHVAAVDKK